MATQTIAKPKTKATAAASIKVFSVDRDLVVNALVATGRTTYAFALSSLVPLISRLEIQRDVQNPRFYERLKRDLLKGCLMPPITLAFVRKSQMALRTPAQFQSYVSENIKNAFVLDGIQRLHTLKRAYDEDKRALKLTQPLFLNILVCSSTDNLLYRMITLNNGQRPMSTRHQIEILSANTFNVEGENIVLATEKGGIRRQHGIFSKADFVLAYMAFLSNSITVDSQKLIQDKLDDLIANKILEHEPEAGALEFTEVMALIEEFTQKKEIDRWFKVTNNLVGFCAGIREGHEEVSTWETETFWEYLEQIDRAFDWFDVSKLKVGRARRSVVAYCIKNAATMIDMSDSEMTEKLMNVIEP